MNDSELGMRSIRFLAVFFASTLLLYPLYKYIIEDGNLFPFGVLYLSLCFMIALLDMKIRDRRRKH